MAAKRKNMRQGKINWRCRDRTDKIAEREVGRQVAVERRPE